MASCVLGARLSMSALVLKSLYLDDGNEEADTPAPAVADAIGHWEYTQDPDSGAIEKTWVTDVIDDPATPDVDESTTSYHFRSACEIRGIMDGGIRVAGSTQRFSEIYENVEWVKGTFPKTTDIAKGDRVTDIRNQKNELIWQNEENVFPGTAQGATVFVVMGVTPILDPFGNYVEQSVLMQRAEVQTNVA